MSEKIQHDDAAEPTWLRCWSFNQSGARCQQIAGHDGKHAVATEWTDTEAWTPDLEPMKAVPVGRTDPALVEHLVKVDAVCIVCDHPDHRGKCGMPEGDFECDCSEGIPG